MRTQNPFRIAPLALAAGLACSGPVLAQSLPHGATVINGSAAINTFSNGMQVINTPGTILNWQSFSIGNGRTVRFDQVNAQSAVLNRVTGNAHSDILGTLQSNGRVFLLNPNGIVFGAGSVVDTAGLIASTLNISNEDFLAGNYRFSCFNATVCEAGVDVLNPYNNRIVLQDGSRITTRAAGEGGQVWLIARDRVVSEKGSSVDAPTGQLMAAAAREVTVTSPALGQMSFTLAGTYGSRVDLEGDIDVARGAAGFFADTVRLAGTVRARSDVDAAGQIVARASSEIAVDEAARLDVSGNAGADAGAVRLAATQKIMVHTSSEIAADAGMPTAEQVAPKGGLIELEAYQVSLPWAISAAQQASYPGQNHVTDEYNTGSQLHAYAQGAAQGDFSRHGSIVIRETGSFTLSEMAVDLPFKIGAYINNDTSPGPMERLQGLVRAGDGSVLMLTQEDYGLHAVKVRVVSPSGSVGSASVVHAAYQDGDVDVVYFTELLPLARGGWVVMFNYQAAAGGVLADHALAVVLDAQGAVVRRIDVAVHPDEVYPLRGATVWATQGGGFAMTSSAGGTPVTRAYLANGQLDTQTPADRITPARALSQHSSTVNAQFVSFDPRYDLELTHVDAGLGNALASVRMVDPVTGTVSWTHPAYPLAQGLQLSPMDVAFNGGMLSPGLHFAAEPNRGSGLMDVLMYDAHGQVVRTIGQTGANYLVDGLYGAALDIRPLGSDVLAVVQYSSGGPANLPSTGALGFYTRQPVALPAAGMTTSGNVLAAPLLATMPGQSNGTAGGGVTQPPVDPGPGTGNPGTGNPGTPPPAPGRSFEGELPPPAYFPSTRAPGLEVASAPITIPASTVTDTRTQAEIDTELRADAERLVREYMGPQDAARFAAAKTDEERRPFMKEVAYAMTVGQDVYDATRSLGEEMRAAMFNGWGTAQLWGMDNDDEDFSGGLMKAMTEKLPAPPNEDGSPGVPRTRLQVAFDVADLELKQAKTKEEKEKIGRRVFRDMVHAARAASGQEVDPDADLVLSDGNGGTVRINDEGDMVYEKGSGEG